MSSFSFNDEHDHHDPRADLDHDDDADTASARSIPLSSPPASRPLSTLSGDPYGGFSSESDAYGGLASAARTQASPDPEPYDPRASRPSTLSTEGSEAASLFSGPGAARESNSTSPTPSIETKEPPVLATYPPPPPQRASVASFATDTSAASGSRKARPESVLLDASRGPIVLGIALVDFNHQVGPRIEYSRGDVFADEEIARILPFLALPDGAHLSVEDYSYFHLVPVSPNPTTIFGISCNRQIATNALLVKDPDMTRSTVQKAVVVLASKPIFGPIRDRLGVITNALFEQRDFTDMTILDAFHESLEPSVRSQMTESGLYMGTNLRELVRQFRHRTLVLVKALMLQKKIMFYGHPVEKLCTYQYSLVSLFPSLLQTLEDSGSPPLCARAPTLVAPPTSLKTSDRKSMMAFVGFPLDLFGKDAFFQPYLPLQQLDLIKSPTQAFLCGATNSIVTQSKEIEIVVNIEAGAVEFRAPAAERAVALTPADRKWIDDIVRDVQEEMEYEEKGGTQRFKGSDDYLRVKFEEYISAALASVKYADFLAKGESAGVLITPGSGGDANAQMDFNPVWIAEFKRTNAFEVWHRITDPMLFDIVEPRHPCGEKPSAISDIGLRLSEGIQDLKLEQQLAPAREAVSRTLAAGSTNFFKAVEGVRGRWMQRVPSETSPPASSAASARSIEAPAQPQTQIQLPPPTQAQSPTSPLSPDLKAAAGRISSWGAGIGSFFSARSSASSTPASTTPASTSPQLPPNMPPLAQPTQPSSQAPPPKSPSPPAAPPPKSPSPAAPPMPGTSKLKSFRMSTHGSVLGDPNLAGLARRATSPSRPQPQRPSSPSRGMSYRSSSPPRSDVVPVGSGSVAGSSRPGSVVGGGGGSRPGSMRLSPARGARTLSPEPFEQRPVHEGEDSGEGPAFGVAL